MKLDLESPFLKRNNGTIFGSTGYHPNKPVALVYASCHGRTLLTYFEQRPEFLEKYSVLRLETGPFQTALNEGVDPFEVPIVRDIFRSACVLITYNMGARHGKLSLENVSRWLQAGCKVITMVAPNCSCFWPWAYGYEADLGIADAIYRGKTEQQIWSDFLNGQFDPMFHLRWRTEIGRLEDKEKYHDIPLAGFVMRNYRKAKLWTAPSHPTFNTMAYLGNEILARLGYPREEEEKILSYPYMNNAMAGQAETNYEFNYYRFEYPKRHENDWDHVERYREILSNIFRHIKTGGLITPPWD